MQIDFSSPFAMALLGFSTLIVVAIGAIYKVVAGGGEKQRVVFRTYERLSWNALLVCCGFGLGMGARNYIVGTEWMWAPVLLSFLIIAVHLFMRLIRWLHS